MDTCEPYNIGSPRWIARAPPEITALLTDRPHSKDTHLGFEDYPEKTVRVAFDFGRLTYRIIKEIRFLEEDRHFAYLSAAVAHPSASPFAVATTSMPPLSDDVVPAKFPASR